MSFAFCINSIKGLLGTMVHVENSSTFRGIQNLECDVLPLGISNAAIPLEATVKTITPFERNA